MRPVCLFFFALILCSCSDATKIEDANATEITLPNGKKILAETMRQPVDLQRGMMFRDSLPKDRGMFFVYPKADKYPHWTYNVRVPLDVVWLAHNHRIVEIVPNTPPCASKTASSCPSFGGVQIAQFILELNAGEAEKNGLKAGIELGF